LIVIILKRASDNRISSDRQLATAKLSFA